MPEKIPTPGQVALLGSGETSLAGGRLLELLARSLPRPLRMVLLETPSGFELNSEKVVGRVADSFKNRLQNYDPIIEVIPARKRGTTFSPDDPGLCTPLQTADLIFMGPGSPTYAVRQLQGSLAWKMICWRHRMGAALLFSSAATIAIGMFVLPVYEIFKAGEDVSAPGGLDFFQDYGLSLSFTPHWNNAEGGADLDTSRCFVGMERHAEWRKMVASTCTCVGLDEHTGLLFDFSDLHCRVHGVSSVTLLKGDSTQVIPAGADFSMKKLGRIHIPEILNGNPGTGFPGLPAPARHEVQEKEPPSREVIRIAEERHAARMKKNWKSADELRERLHALGWRVIDHDDAWSLERL